MGVKEGDAVDRGEGSSTADGGGELAPPKANDLWHNRFNVWDPWLQTIHMIIRTPHEVALLARERRRSLGMTQAQLAERIGASREWVRLLESGKPRLELGLTLRALTALGVIVDMQLVEPYPAQDTQHD